MKLYYAPGACSIGIHVLLEEIGRPYETERVDFAAGAQLKPPFADINPKRKVPLLLRDDGSTLTEFPAIAYYLARTNPAAGLLPDDAEAATRAFELMEYAVSTVHMQGFQRIFRPRNFTPHEVDYDAVKARGREIFFGGLSLIDERLGDTAYAVGDTLSIADAALFYVSFWGGDRLKATLPPRVGAHYARMKARPAVQRVMQREGFA